MANANTTERANYNVCENWGLYCFEQRFLEGKGVVLKCSMNSKDKKTGKYSVPIYIDVVCLFDSCDIAQDEYAKQNVNVWGTFKASSFVNQNTKEEQPQMTIYASKVVKFTR